MPEIKATEELRIARARYKHLQSEPHPQFGCAGRHHGTGAPDCPRPLHHHHDDFCSYPTPMECETARVPWRHVDEWGSRA